MGGCRGECVRVAVAGCRGRGWVGVGGMYV